MSASRRQAEKEAFRAVAETCPFVDDALSDAAKLIKDQTSALREALIEAIQRANEAEEEAEVLRRQVANLERELDEARAAA